MTALDVIAAREALARRVYANDGWIMASAIDGQREWAAIMPALVRDGLFEWRCQIPGVHVARYALTDAGKAWAAELQ